MSVPADPVLIRHLNLKNLLSFGPDNPGIDLTALNVLIGPNGSGKSNVIEAINLLRAAPKELEAVIRTGGGVAEWIWKGDATNVATIACSLRNPESVLPLLHLLSFGVHSQRFTLVDEQIRDTGISPPNTVQQYYEGFADGTPNLWYVQWDDTRRWTQAPTTKPNLSVLAQVQDELRFPELYWLNQSYGRIRIYREWSFGRNAVFRSPQKADMRNDVLEEDFSNLGLILNKLKTRFPAAKKAILSGLKELYDGIQDFDVLVEGGTVQVFFTEGDFVIPATRLSDGTLRYLCLLAILCDPSPPPLICLEEPELGLHPDILPTLAELLIAASERTQLIVTTHSDILVDAMTERPEAVVVCEKHDGKTEMTRLSKSELAVWLEKYRLGQLWIDGQLGGKRW